MSTPSEIAARAYPGRLTDGKSAASRAVLVQLTGEGVEIRREDGAASAVWPYATLTSASPLGGKTDHVLLGSESNRGATLFVDSHELSAELARHAVHLTARAARLRHAAPWIWACVGLLALGTAIWSLNLSPAHAVAHLLPDRTRNALGGQVVSSMSAGRKICNTPYGRAALDKMVARLSEAAGARQPFRVSVVDWSLVNAFAAPGEQIVVTRGLIAKAGGPDEVAGVLAHEMGHGLELHPETGIVRLIGMSAAIELMSGGSSGTIGNVGVLLAQFSYTRTAEREADAHALRLIKQAGISQQGIIDFFRRVEKMEPGDARQVEILRTHPQLAERRQLAEAMPRYPSTPALSDGEWKALQAICAAP